jgi:hypothetical protein
MLLAVGLAGCGSTSQSPTAVPSDSLAPPERLAQALAASAAATAFHVEAVGESTNRPVTVLPVAMMGGAIKLVGDVDVTRGIGDFVMTIASSPGRSWHLRSVAQADGNPLVLLESVTKPGQWLSNPGVIFGNALGAFTGPDPSNPATVFAQLGENVARLGADGPVSRVVDRPCGSRLCEVLEIDASAGIRRIFCKAAAASACPVVFLVDFLVDASDQRIVGVESAFQRSDTKGNGSIAFSNWGQPLTIAIPSAAEITPGDGNLP